MAREQGTAGAQGRGDGLENGQEGSQEDLGLCGRGLPTAVSCQVACDFWAEAIATLFMFLPPGYEPAFICRSDLGS